MDNELYHHGVKGMKWGIRRKQSKARKDTTFGVKRKARRVSSARDVTKVKKKELDKQFREKLDKNEAPNSSALMNEMRKDIKNLKASRDKERFESDIMKKKKRDDKVIHEYMVLLEKHKRAVNDYFEKNKDRMASAALKDLGYEDTEKGRKYIRKMIVPG